MPQRDSTGPEGRGSRTGRQMGDCEDAVPIAGRRDSQGQGRGMGRGRGAGRGAGRGR